MTKNGDEAQLLSNVEMWTTAVNGSFLDESVFEDQEGNRIVWTGCSFQGIYTETDEENEKYIGMTKGDLWKFIGLYDDVFKE